MTPGTKYVLAFSALVALGAAAVVQLRQGRSNLARLRRQARPQFHCLDVQSSDPRLSFKGSSAHVVREEDTGNAAAGDPRHYFLSIYARNDAGEYFLFKSGSTPPYIKHVPQHVARIVLGSMYVPPPQNGS